MSQRGDQSTIDIIQWLLHWGTPFVRIDLEDVFQIERVELNSNGKHEFVIFNDAKRIVLSEIKAFWYRRGQFNIPQNKVSSLSDIAIAGAMHRHMLAENEILSSFFYFLLQQVPHIGTYDTRGMNKLQVLYEASKLGLKIPHSVVTSSKEQVSSTQFKSNGQTALITKCISESIGTYMPSGQFTTYTEKVLASELSERFFPTLFQELVEKEADIRIFYLLGDFYAMAIRSQENSQTSTDFRKYDKKQPNRNVPFNLPEYVREKLTKLMDAVGLQTGSIDIVLTRCGRFVFLEVNPVGQFGMTSYPCNYQIERKLALTLKKMTEHGMERQKAI